MGERDRQAAQAQLELGAHALPQVLRRLPVRHAGDGFHLVLGDSQVVLPALPDACVDLVFADPPYRLSNGGTSCRSGQRVAVDKGAWDASQGLAADHDWNVRWLRQVQRVLRPSGTLWVSGTQHVIFSLGFALQQLGFHLLNTVTWFKPNATPNLGCRQLTHSTELVLWAAPAERDPPLYTFHYDRMRAANGGVQLRDLWTFTPPAADERAHGVLACTCGRDRAGLDGIADHVDDCPARAHPTQKPRALLDRIMAATTSFDHLVLDPFNGSGTTGVSARAAGCRYVGIDTDAGWLDLTHRRLTTAQGG